MQKEGPQPGYINIVVARRISVLSPLTPPPGDEHREFRISMTETPKPLSPQEVSNDEIFEDTSVWSAYSDEATRAELEAQYASHKVRNPMINRLLGGSSLRNVSYQKALNDTTLNESDVTQSDSFQQTSTPNHRRTVSTPSRENAQPDTVMIEGGGYGVQMRQNPSQKPRPASTLGFAQPDQEPPSQRQSLSRSNENLLEESGPPQPPTWLTDWDKQRTKSEEEPLSPSPEDPFRREGFGRQSISEKRKNHIDPKVSEFYLHMKQKRDDKGDQVQRYDSATWDSKMAAKYREQVKAEKNSVGPTLGLKKSSSLESLQAALQGVEPEEEIDEETSGGVTRGRGCNESFRAAVDRSYDPVPASTMETLLEEGIENGSRSARSSFSDTGDDLNRKKRKSKKEKDKGGIFKGFGNMFKFGKNRKALEDSRHIMTPAELKREHEEEQRRQKQQEIEHYHARKHQNNAQMDRDEVHMSRREQEQALDSEMQPHPHQMMNDDEGEPAGDEFEMMKTEVTRNDRIQQLRLEHQRKHRERQGKYPLEDKEEQYEKELQEIEKRRQRQALQDRQEREQQDRKERERQDRQEREVCDRQERERQERKVHERQEREVRERQEKEAEREHRAREQEHQSQRGSQSREPMEIPPKRRPPEQNHRAQEVSRQVVYRDPEHYSHYQNLNEIQANLQKHDQYQQKYRDYFGQQPRRPAPPLHQTRITVHQPEDRSYNDRREPSGQEYQSRSRYDNPDASRYYNNNRNGTRSASDSRLGLDPRGGYMGRSDYDQRRPSNQDRPYYRNNSASLEGGNSWGPPSYSQHRRSVTPIDRGEERDLDSRGPPPSYRGYHPGMVPPSAYPPRYDSRQPPQRGRMEQSRGYADFDDPRMAYHNQRESSSSMPSREWHRNGSIPGSAQV